MTPHNTRPTGERERVLEVDARVLHVDGDVASREVVVGETGLERGVSRGIRCLRDQVPAPASHGQPKRIAASSYRDCGTVLSLPSASSNATWVMVVPLSETMRP